jgi:hypothetical protein
LSDQYVKNTQTFVPEKEMPNITLSSRSRAIFATLAVATGLSALAGCGGGGGAAGLGSTPFATAPIVSVPSTSPTTSKAAALSFGASGIRGYLPITIQVGATGKVSYQPIDANSGLTFSGDSNEAVTLTAPAGYADRQFVKWQQGGQDVSTQPTMTFTPASLVGSGPVTAVYQAKAATDGAFTPNFSKPGFPTWDHMPVRIFVDNTVSPGSVADISIRNGLNRWVLASGGLISLAFATDATTADVTIGFGGTPTGLAALTNAWWNGANHLTKATVALNPPVLGPNQILNQNLDTIVAHEFGHALGLISDSDFNAGHSTDPADTMYPTGNTAIGLISARDINTVATSYVNLFTGGRSAPTGGGTGEIHHAQVN